LAWSIDVDQGKVLHYLLHLLKLKQRREAAFTWERERLGERERERERKK
jgi:hypothetical protein